MTPSPHSDLHSQRENLREQVTSLLESCTSDQANQLRALQAPLEPEFASALEDLFSKTSIGKKEAERMELDILRRVSRCDETEHIFRPYGVLEVVTPVRMDGKTCFALCSGPLLVEKWTSVAQQTLAKLSGTKLKNLPKPLASASLYTPSQIKVVSRLQEQQARWIEHHFSSVHSSESSDTSLSTDALNLLQPGFIDHLDLLYKKIQQATQVNADLPSSEVLRLHKIAERGRTLTKQATRLRDQSASKTSSQSVHAVLATWCGKLEQDLPHVRIRTRFEAQHDTLVTRPEKLHHLFYTLLSGIADGLPEGRALLGVSTRNEVVDGKETLHVEIRDGGGLQTFAGVGGEIDSALTTEQHQAEDELSDWTALASTLQATIRILRDADTVTRAEVFLPLSVDLDQDTETEGRHVLWIVEDDDHEVDHLQHMVQSLPLTCVRFNSAAELKQNFSTASTAPDMILLKYYLPDERGAEVRNWLYEQDSNLPVVIVSSLDATHPGIATVQRLPSTLYLQKPFTAQELVNMIHLNLDDTLSG